MASTGSEEQVRARAKAAILGALVADAASMGLHWIYDPAKMAELTAGKAEVAFYDPPSCPFYKAVSGDLSPYGFELLALLQHLAAAGEVKGEDTAKALAASYSGYTGYLNKSSKAVKEAVAAGKAYPHTGHETDAQANAFVKAPALVGLLAGRPGLSAAVETAVRVQQNNDAAVSAGAAGALLLERVVATGDSVEGAVQWALSADSPLPAEVRQQLAAALELRGLPFKDAVAKLGASCGLPASLQCAVLGAVLHGGAGAGAGGPEEGAYAAGVRDNITAGGDNCSRAVLLGALLAAQHGLSSLPPAWTAATADYGRYEQLVDQQLAHRG